MINLFKDINANIIYYKGPVRFAEKTNRNTILLICCERKILFRLKKQVEKDKL